MARRSLRFLGSLYRPRYFRRTMYNSLKENDYFPAYDPQTEHPFKIRNEIKARQRYLKIEVDDTHVYRKGGYDLVPYRMMLAFSVGAVLFMFYDVFRLAGGTLPRKERSS